MGPLKIVGVTRNKVGERVDGHGRCNESLSYGPLGNSKVIVALGMTHDKLCFGFEKT